jgi:hypothetical protein
MSSTILQYPPWLLCPLDCLLQIQSLAASAGARRSKI